MSIAIPELLFISTILATTPSFEIVDIGTFGTGPCGAHDVSQVNTACGQGTAPNGLSQHAFYWDGVMMHNIQPLNAPDGGNTWGFGLNNLGQVVGYSNTGGAGFHAYRWSLVEGTVDLGVPSWSAGDYSQAKDINDGGTVAGLAGTVPNNIRGCIWINGQMLEVPTLGGSESQCNAVNEQDDVVGMSRLESGKMRAFVVPDGNVEAMIVLEAPEGGGAWATDINEARMVCGWGADADGVYHALSWTLKGGMQFLGEPDGWQSFAYDINESGWIVGKAWDAAGDSHACAWIDGSFLLLADQVKETPSGAEFRLCRAINDSGWIATSLAFDDADNHAAILKPLSDGPAGDVTGDGVVNADDVLAVLAAWGDCPPPCPEDINGDGQVDTDEILIVLADWTL